MKQSLEKLLEALEKGLFSEEKTLEIYKLLFAKQDNEEEYVSA